MIVDGDCHHRVDDSVWVAVAVSVVRGVEIGVDGVVDCYCYCYCVARHCTGRTQYSHYSRTYYDCYYSDLVLC